MTKKDREPTFKYCLSLSASDKLLVDQILKDKKLYCFADAIRYAIRLAAMTPVKTPLPLDEQQVCTPNVPS